MFSSLMLRRSHLEAQRLHPVVDRPENHGKLNFTKVFLLKDCALSALTIINWTFVLIFVIPQRRPHLN